MRLVAGRGTDLGPFDWPALWVEHLDADRVDFWLLGRLQKEPAGERQEYCQKDEPGGPDPPGVRSLLAAGENRTPASLGAGCRRATRLFSGDAPDQVSEAIFS